VRPLFLLCLLPLAASADQWIRFTSGPFEVWSSTGATSGRETLVRFEEFRYALGQALGSDDLNTALPVRILLFKTGAPATPEPIIRGRDRYDIVLTSAAPGPQVFARLTQLFLESNTARMPEALEHGLVDLFSTIEVSGIRITLGRPPANPDLDWARVHLLAVDSEYYGKLRVITYNLRNGVDQEAAFRNAIGKSPAQIEQQAKQHLAAGRFETVSISPRAMSPKDFPERSVEPAAARLAVADLLFGDQSRAAYRDLIAQKTDLPEAWEGLGMLADRAGQTDEALQDFASAIDAGSKSASCFVAYARLEPDNAKALAALDRALQLNPKIAEAHFLRAKRQTDPAKRMQELKQATALDKRNSVYWEALAQASVEAKDFKQAEQAWRAAAQAAATPADRARLETSRQAVEAQRLDWEASESKRKADEQASEIEKLKAQARAELHAIETRANSGQAPAKSGEKIEGWWDAPQPAATARGILKQVDCLGKRYRLVVEADDGKTYKLLVANPSQIILSGGATLTLHCGPQKRRRVQIGYTPKPDAKLATAGEVATIEFE